MPKKLKHDIFENQLDGNAHSIINKFIKQARAEGWTAPEIDKVIKEAQSGDYDYMIQTIMRHTK